MVKNLAFCACNHGLWLWWGSEQNAQHLVLSALFLGEKHIGVSNNNTDDGGGGGGSDDDDDDDE